MHEKCAEKRGEALHLKGATALRRLANTLRLAQSFFIINSLNSEPLPAVSNPSGRLCPCPCRWRLYHRGRRDLLVPLDHGCRRAHREGGVSGRGAWVKKANERSGFFSRVARGGLSSGSAQTPAKSAQRCRWPRPRCRAPARNLALARCPCRARCRSRGGGRGEERRRGRRRRGGGEEEKRRRRGGGGDKEEETRIRREGGGGEEKKQVAREEKQSGEEARKRRRRAEETPRTAKTQK